MDMRQAFPGQHIKCADLNGQTATLTIAAIAMGKVGDDEKPIMKFYETQQDLVLNKTNSNVLIEAWGPESQGWIGRQVQLYPTRVQFGAEMVDAVRVQVPQQAPQGYAQPAPGQPAPGQGQYAPPGAPAPAQAPYAPPPALAPGAAPSPHGFPGPAQQGAPAPAPAPYAPSAAPGATQAAPAAPGAYPPPPGGFGPGTGNPLA